MEVAFWSREKHQNGVTTAVAALSILWSNFYQDVAVTANHFCTMGIYERLIGKEEREERFRRKDYFYHYGEPGYYRMIQEQPTTVIQRQGQCALCHPPYHEDSVTLRRRQKGHIRYVTMDGRHESSLFSEGGLEGIRRQIAQKELLFIDTACGCGMNTQRILEEARGVVIVLPADKKAIDELFESCQDLADRGFFLLGNYAANAKGFPAYLQKKYKVKRERIGIIPYDEEFAKAMRMGRTLSYMEEMFLLGRATTNRFAKAMLRTLKLLKRYVKERGEKSCNEYAEA